MTIVVDLFYASTHLMTQKRGPAALWRFFQQGAALSLALL
jgi:hypothetical protein